MGGGYVPLTSMVLRWFSIRKSLMTAIVMSGGGLGTVIASPVANYLLSMFDWRVSYLIIGCFVLVGILVAAQFLKRDPAQMGLQPYGEQKRTEDGPKLEARGFTLKETIATRQFWIFNTFSFCLGFSAYVLVVHIVPYIIDLGISSTIGASILATIGAFSVIGRLIMGASADRIGNRMVTSIGFMVLLAALVLLLPAKDVWTFYLFAALFGFAWSSGVAVSPLVAELFGLGSHGFILALASIGFNIGAVFGPVAGGYIFDVTHSYQLAFILCIVLSIVGVILPLLLKPIKRKI
jgi:predicted MFS family arabinose efflux permease